MSARLVHSYWSFALVYLGMISLGAALAGLSFLLVRKPPQLTRATEAVPA